eukprot:UN24714
MENDDVEEFDDLYEYTDEDFKDLGMSKVAIRKFRKKMDIHKREKSDRLDGESIQGRNRRMTMNKHQPQEHEVKSKYPDVNKQKLKEKYGNILKNAITNTLFPKCTRNFVKKNFDYVLATKLKSHNLAVLVNPNYGYDSFLILLT